MNLGRAAFNMGICIDGIIRDRFEQFDRVYRKKFIKNHGIVQMNENFEYVQENENEDEEKRLSNLEESLIHLPITTYDLKNHYEFESEAEYLKFMDDYSLEIYGSAPAFPKAMDAANRIQHISENENWFNVYLLCPGDEQLVTSTYYFLTKNACRIKNIRFGNYDYDVIEGLGVIVTDSPEVLQWCSGKISVKINKPYNTNSQADFSINDISELNDFNFLQTLYNKYEELIAMPKI
jgi:hypothetical protein